MKKSERERGRGSKETTASGSWIVEKFPISFGVEQEKWFLFEKKD